MRPRGVMRILGRNTSLMEIDGDGAAGALGQEFDQPAVVIRVAVAEDHCVNLVDIVFQSFQIVEQGQGGVGGVHQDAADLALVVQGDEVSQSVGRQQRFL